MADPTEPPPPARGAEPSSAGEPLPDPDWHELPTPEIRPRRRWGLSLVWLVPLVALAVAASLFVRTVILVGPRIDIEFASAEGIEPGRTDVRYKEVVIGRVESVSLRGDGKRVVAVVRLDRSAAGLAVEDTLFWVVRPRIGMGGISGLGTLLSGAYIGADAGVSSTTRYNFVGLEAPPFVLRGEPGAVFELLAEDLGSLEVGSPVYYRRTRVGRVVGYALDAARDQLSVRVFIEAPYHTLVTPEARFWNASGVDLRLNASGLTLNTQTIASVIAGGIAFELPPGVGRGAPASDGATFALFSDRRSALAPADGQAVPIRMVFEQTVRGLAENAPIDFLGIDIGRVSAVAVDYDAKRRRFLVHVAGEIFPLRLGLVRRAFFSGTAGDPTAEMQVVQRLVERGLRAQLRTGNLLTGQSYVALEIDPKARGGSAQVVDGALELPTLPGTLSEIQPQLAEIVGKLSRVPFDEIGSSLQTTLKGVGGLVDQLGPAAQKSLTELQTTLKSANAAIAQLTPEAQKAVGELQRTLARAQTSLENLDRNITDPGAPVQRQVEDTMQELQRVSRSIRALTDYLQIHPEALLRGKPADPAIPGGRGR